MAIRELPRLEEFGQTITGQPSIPLNFTERLALLIYSLEFLKNPAEYMIKGRTGFKTNS